jgi:hypothetical protein
MFFGNMTRLPLIICQLAVASKSPASGTRMWCVHKHAHTTLISLVAQLSSQLSKCLFGATAARYTQQGHPHGQRSEGDMHIVCTSSAALMIIEKKRQTRI